MEYQGIEAVILGEIERLEIDVNNNVEGALLVELTEQFAHPLCQNRPGVAKQMLEIVKSLRAQQPETDEFEEAIAALSKPI